MGWLYKYDMPRGGTNAWMRDLMTWENEKVRTTCLDAATVGLREGYAAVEQVRKDTGERSVVAAVFLFDFNGRGQGTPFGYKDMDETMGPAACSCPERILDLLTPTDNALATRWRAECRDRIAKRRRARKGTWIRMSTPLGFTNGKHHDLFEVVHAGKNRFRVVEDGRPSYQVRISNWTDRDFEIVRDALADRSR